MATMLPRDADNLPIPALRLRPDGAHAISVGATSVRNSVAFAPETRVVSIYATGPVFLRTGGADAVAGTADHYIPGDLYLDISLGGFGPTRHSHVAVVRAAADCILYVSEKE